MTAMVSASTPLDAVLRDFAQDTRCVVGLLQHPRPGDGNWQDRTKKLCEELSVSLGELAGGLSSTYGAMPEALDDLGNTLRETTAVLHERPNRRQLKGLRDSLAQDYEDLVAQLRPLPVSATLDESALRALRFPRIGRSALHIAVGLGVTLFYALWVGRATALWVMSGFLAVLVGIEVSRRVSARLNDFLVFKVFSAISRPRERYAVNSATYYLAAAILITFIAPREAVGAALLTLAFGDPLASFVGSRFGRVKLFRDKSLAGALAFVAAAAIAVGIYWAIALPEMSLASLVLRATVVAVVGAVVELFSHPIDDNFSIPVVCALTAMLLLG